jgi:transposase
MRSFSPDLVSKIVSAYNEPGSTIRSVAKRIGVSKNIVQKYVTREREGWTNETEPRQSSRSILKSHTVLLRKMFQEQPNETLARYCEILKEKTGLQVSIPTMCRAASELKSRKSRSKKSKL